MSGAIRNHRVGAGVIAATGGVVAYTVPAGYVLLLKNIQFFSGAAAAQGVSVQIAAADVGVSVYILNVTLNPNDIAAWNGWTALNAGDYITPYAGVGSLHYWIAGALLPYIPGQGGLTIEQPMVESPEAGTVLPLPPELVADWYSPSQRPT